MTHNPAELSKHPIQRRILHAGGGDIPDFHNGDRVTFHYKTLQPAGGVQWSDVPVSECAELLTDKCSEVVDDSHKLGGGKPMQLILGKQFKLIVWEQCVKMMRLGEVSAFLCDTDYCVPYPLISKTLRDVGKGAKTQSSHCCGAQLMADGVGYEDLNALMKQPRPLIFILELVEVEAADTYDKEHWYMTETERSVSVQRLHEQGNALYRQQEYTAAGERYSEALGHLESLSLREKPGESEWLELEERKMPLLLNYSQCLLKLHDYYQVIQHTTTVIDKHPESIKALFRRGCAYVQVFEPERAHRDLEKVKTLETCDEATARAVDKQLDLLEHEIRKKKAEDVKMFGGKLLA